MIKHLSVDFKADEAMEVEGGARGEMASISVGEYEGLASVGYFKMSKGFQYKPHRHKGWLIITILKGRLEVRTLGHEDQIFQAGDTYLVEPRQCHTETALEDDTVVVVTKAVKDHKGAYQMHTVEV